MAISQIRSMLNICQRYEKTKRMGWKVAICSTMIVATSSSQRIVKRNNQPRVGCGGEEFAGANSLWIKPRRLNEKASSPLTKKMGRA